MKNKSGNICIGSVMIIMLLAVKSLGGDNVPRPDGINNNRREPHHRRYFNGMRTENILYIMNEEAFVKELKIDKNKRMEIINTFKAFKEEEKSYFLKMENVARKQAYLLCKEKIDKEELMKKIEEIGEIRTEIAKINMRKLIYLRETFTGKQLELIGRKAEKIRMRMHENRRKELKKE